MTMHLPLYAEVGISRFNVIQFLSEMFFVFVFVVFLDFASRDAAAAVVVIVFGVGVAVVCLVSPAG